MTEHRIWHLERLRRGDSASLGTKVGTCWARWLAAGSICAWGLAWAPSAIRRLGARTDAVGLQSVGPGLWRPRGRAIEADAELDAQMPNSVLSHTPTENEHDGAGQTREKWPGQPRPDTRSRRRRREILRTAGTLVTVDQPSEVDPRHSACAHRARLQRHDVHQPGPTGPTARLGHTPPCTTALDAAHGA